MKKPVLLSSLLLFPALSFAREAATTGKSLTGDQIENPMILYYLTLTFLFVAVVLVILVAIQVLRLITFLDEHNRKEAARRHGVPYLPPQGWGKRFMQRMNASVPVELEKHIELEHSYDGIRELDNHLPPWWKWLFYGTIVWGVVYMILFHLTATLPLAEEEYRIEIAQAEEQGRLLKANEPAIDENTLQYTADPDILEKGRSVFSSNPCGSCHRNDGGGNTIGPNLTDEYWIHGGDIKNILNTIKEGAVDKGMPAWGKAMSAQDLRNLTFYILSLQGTNPPDAKDPQGDLFKQPTEIKTDSTETRASL